MIEEDLDKATESDDIHANLDLFYEVLTEVCDPLFKVNIKQGNKKN